MKQKIRSQINILEYTLERVKDQKEGWRKGSYKRGELEGKEERLKKEIDFLESLLDT